MTNYNQNPNDDAGRDSDRTDPQPDLPPRNPQSAYAQYGMPKAGQNGDPYANQQGNPYTEPQYNRQNHNPQPGWQPVDPFKLVESMLPQRAKNWVRGFYAVIGIVAIVLGMALLIWPGITLKIAAILLGVYFVVSGLVRVTTAIVELGLPGGWRVLDILVGVLLAIGGMLMLKNAAASGQALALLVTLTVGIGWMLEGFMALVESWRLPSSGWAVLYAVISIIAGFVVLVSPVSSTVWLVIFGGCALVVMGVSAIVRAFRFGRLPKNV